MRDDKNYLIPIIGNNLVFQLRESCLISTIVNGIVLTNTMPFTIVEIRRFDALKCKVISDNWYYVSLIFLHTRKIENMQIGKKIKKRPGDYPDPVVLEILRNEPKTQVSTVVTIQKHCNPSPQPKSVSPSPDVTVRPTWSSRIDITCAIQRRISSTRF